MRTTNVPDVRHARAHGERVARTPQFEWLARAGLAARGVVYAIIGVLALKLALGSGGGKATNQQGALKEIAHQSFGQVLLVLTGSEADLSRGREPRSGVDRTARAQSAVLVVDGRSLPEGAVAALAVIEDLDVVENFGAQLGPCRPARRWMSSFLRVAKKLSATALSKQSPLLPIDCEIPALRACWPNASDTNCPP